MHRDLSGCSRGFLFRVFIYWAPALPGHGFSSPVGRHEQRVPWPEQDAAPPHVAQPGPGGQVGRVQIRHGVAVIGVVHREGVQALVCMRRGHEQHPPPPPHLPRQQPPGVLVTRWLHAWLTTDNLVNSLHPDSSLFCGEEQLTGSCCCRKQDRMCHSGSFLFGETTHPRSALPPGGCQHHMLWSSPPDSAHGHAPAREGGLHRGSEPAAGRRRSRPRG